MPHILSRSPARPGRQAFLPRSYPHRCACIAISPLESVHFIVHIEHVRPGLYRQGVDLVIRGLTGFDWDTANWRKSELKHGVSAPEAQEALLNNPVCEADARHSDVEQRYIALGVTNAGRRLFLAFTIRKNRVRIVSARPMSRKEREIHDAASQAH